MTAPTEERRPSLERSTGVMVGLTTLSRLTGFGRNVALAYAIGQNRLTDAYNVANTTPNIVYELVLGGVLSATLVPLFVSQLATRSGDGHGDEDPWREVSAVFTLVVAVAIAACIAFVVAAPQIIDLYLSGDATADQRAVATTLLRLFGPQIVFYGIITVTTGILEARRRFAAPKFAPVANNLVVIATILALPHVAKDLGIQQFRHDTRGILLLGLGTTAGIGAMALAQVVRLPAAGARLRPVWAPRSPMIRRLVRLSSWTVGVVIANQIALWVTYRLATEEDGAQSAYTAAQLFFLLPYGVYAVSVMSALAPELAERWVHGDAAGLGERVALGIRRTLAVILPAGVGLALVASPLVRVILQHGRFDAHDAHITATTLVCLALGLPGFCCFLLLGRVWQSMQDTRTMFRLYVLENGVNIVLAIALHPRFGVQGLAAAYSIAYAVAAVASLAVLRRRLPAGWSTGLLRWFGALLLAAALVASTTAATLLGVEAALAPGPLRALVQLAAATAVGGLTLVIAAPRLGVREPLSLIEPILRRTGILQATKGGPRR
jgi:putative peptidoglycan lipid II flippase